MRLNLHRRHSEQCTGGHTVSSRSYESDERRRGWKKCYCSIYAGGTLGGTFKRKNTSAIDWDEAKAAAASWEQAGSWEVEAAPGPPPGSVAFATSVPAVAGDCPGRFTIEHATSAYLANRGGRNISESTARKYRTLVNQIRSFAEMKGYVM